MLFQQFYQKLKIMRNRPVFEVHDLDVLFGRGMISSGQLSRWCRKGYIQKIKKGLYVLSDEVSRVHPFLIANLGYQPSYISLETALHEYGFIPEVSQSVMSVTTKKTNSFSALETTFYYKKIRSDAYTGYGPREYFGQEVLMADPEKALTDYLYLRSGQLKQDEDIEELRLNFGEIKEKIDITTMRQYATLYHSQSLLGVVARVIKKM